MRWVKTDIRPANSGGYLVTTEWAVGEDVEVPGSRHLWWQGWGWYTEVRECALSTWKEVQDYLNKLGEENEIQKTK